MIQPTAHPLAVGWIVARSSMKGFPWQQLRHLP
jgi:hypothetical protein